MVLTVTDDDLVRVNMGEPTSNLPPCRFALTKRKRPILARRRADNLMRRGVDGKSALRIQVDDVDTAAVETLGPVLETTSVFRSAPISVLCKWLSASYSFTRL